LQNKQFVILMKISSKMTFENFKNFISFHETFKTKFSTHISTRDLGVQLGGELSMNKRMTKARSLLAMAPVIITSYSSYVILQPSGA